MSGPRATVSVEEIRRIAALARLRLDPEEAERMARDVSSVLEYMAALESVARDPEADRGLPGGEDGAAVGGARAQGAGERPGGGTTEPDRLSAPPARFAPSWREGFFVVPRLPGVAGADGKPDGSP